MKKDISVVMSGEGADELFGGYGRIFRSPHDYYMSRKPLIRNFVNFSMILKIKKKNYISPIDHFFLDIHGFRMKKKKSFKYR